MLRAPLVLMVLAAATFCGRAEGERFAMPDGGLTFELPEGWTATSESGVFLVGPAQALETVSFRLWMLGDPTATPDTALDTVTVEVGRVVDEFAADDTRTGTGRYGGIPCLQVEGSCTLSDGGDGDHEDDDDEDDDEDDDVDDGGGEGPEVDATVWTFFLGRPVVMLQVLDPEGDLDAHLPAVQAFLDGVAATTPPTAPAGARLHLCEAGGVGVYVPAGWSYADDEGALVTAPPGAVVEYRLWSPEYDLGDPLEDESDFEGALGRYLEDIELEDLPVEVDMGGMYAVQMRGSATMGDREVDFVAAEFEDTGPGVYERPAVLLQISARDADVDGVAAQVRDFEASLFRILHR